ncbi:MAG: hypothetical protein AAGK78_06305, partial [Planctomycetota bacterium]
MTRLDDEKTFAVDDANDRPDELADVLRDDEDTPAVAGNFEGESADPTATAALNADTAPMQAVPVEPASMSDETSTQKVGGVILQILISLAIVAVGIYATKWLVGIKTMPAQVPQTRAAPVVTVANVSPTTAENLISENGTIRAARRLSVVPQVGGRVDAVHPEFTAGGTVTGGTRLLEIDRTDYELAKAQADADVQRIQAGIKRLDARRRSASAEVARAETSLQTMQAEAAVAEEEFRRINPGQPIPPLVAKVPQLQEMRASLDASKAMVDD